MLLVLLHAITHLRYHAYTNICEYESNHVTNYARTLIRILLRIAALYVGIHDYLHHHVLPRFISV